METWSGTAKVAAPVLCRFAVSQLRRGGLQEKENETATQRIQYLALNESPGNAPTCTINISVTNRKRLDGFATNLGPGN